jgi:nicotinate-nucleotide pyrophosphorylase (carboxylating)
VNPTPILKNGERREPVKKILGRRMMEFLQEDVGFWDVTSRIVDEKRVSARIIAGSEGVLAGIEEACALLECLGVRVTRKKRDGSQIRKNGVIMEITGNSRDILSAERTTLNVLSQMSGIATQTRRLKDICARHDVRVASTRKTTPGFSSFQKRAVEVGGGDTHRFGLYDAVLIKDNHLKLLGIEEAIRRARQGSFTKKVEIEVEREKDALRAVASGADIVMLDNLSPEETKRIVGKIVEAGMRGKVILEASGIDIERIEEYARTGVDVISTSKLVDSPWFDVSMEII